jgi:hypothetical protein
MKATQDTVHVAISIVEAEAGIVIEAAGFYFEAYSV